jgi:hypothetical protein
MAKRRTFSTSANLQSLAQAALPLSRAEKQELIAILQGMLDAEVEEVDAGALNQTLKDNHPYYGPKGGSGYYEQKIINGCGPYLYLRYWSGGKHRSIYLGKVRSET